MRGCKGAGGRPTANPQGGRKRDDLVIEHVPETRYSGNDFMRWVR